MLFYLFIDHTFFFCCSGIAAGVALFLKDDGVLDFSVLRWLLGIRLMNHEKIFFKNYGWQQEISIKWRNLSKSHHEINWRLCSHFRFQNSLPVRKPLFIRQPNLSQRISHQWISRTLNRTSKYLHNFLSGRK